MPRAKLTFEWIYKSAGEGKEVHVDYVSVPDEGMTPEALEARMEREKQSIQNLRASIQGASSLKEINQWLHKEHRCYSVTRQGEWETPTEASDLALKTY